MGLTAKEVMTRDVITVTPATSLTRFARICLDDGISGCPVVTVDGRLVGVVGKTDLLDRLIQGRHDYSANPDFRRLMGLGEEGVYGLSGSAAVSEEEVFGQVDDIMRTDFVPFPPDAPIEKIAHHLAAERIHRVIVSENDRVVGIITSLDLLAHFGGKR